jgi:lysophospholipase L1-like esterase
MYKHHLFKVVLVLLLAVAKITWAAPPKIKIACIGNSITYGSGLKNRAAESYPARLQTMLGQEQYEVLNFGVSGATMLKKGNKPYWNTPEYKQVINSNPDIVFIKLGTNDSKLINRSQMQAFEQDYTDMVRVLKSLATHPRIVLLLPVKAFSDEKFGISGTYLKDSINPVIQKIAYQEKLEILNLYSLFADKEALFPDQIHPNAEGAGYIASRLNEFLAQKKTAGFNIFSKLKEPFKEESFYGYACAKFTFKGREAKIVKPKRAAKGNPWVWRARFWGHEPQADIALLERGFHIAYSDVSELYGNKEAIAIWNSYYSYLHGLGLAKKVALEGMSRGGVYAYNWAAVNPTKVACVYADNPVLDLKSWPGGKGTGSGSKKDWEIFKNDYDYKTDEEAIAFKGSPIDKIDLIVKGKYPMLHVCGDADEAVPMAENTTPFAEKINQAGGNIQVLIKAGARHHPHSLPNPQPIVDFILKATGY